MYSSVLSLSTGLHFSYAPSFAAIGAGCQDYDLFQALLDMPTGDPWDDAEMWAVYAYVRASKFLEMPAAYKPVLFTRAS